jgi:Spy/CpxP family protein refolding chaperone
MRIGKNLMMLVAVATVMFAVSAALAQPPGGQGRGFGRGFGRGGMFGGGTTDPTTLLTQESVQKDLELTDDQKTKVTKLADEAQQARQDMFQGLNFQPGQPPSQEDMQAMQKKQDELVAQNKKKAADILVPQQQQRLDEIVLQYSLEGQGGGLAGAASALAADDLSKKLGLTEDQKKKLTDLQTEGQTKMQDLIGGGGFDPQEMAKVRTEFKDKAIAVLTADQKAKLEKMEGKKFDVSTIQGRGGFGRGRGGRGGPGGPGGAGPGA